MASQASQPASPATLWQRHTSACCTMKIAALAALAFLATGNAVTGRVAPQEWVDNYVVAFEQGVELYRRGRASRQQLPLQNAVRLLRRSVQLVSLQNRQAAEPSFYLAASLALLGRTPEAQHVRCVSRLTSTSCSFSVHV